MKLDDVDLLDLDQYVESPPFDHLELLRGEAPVHRHAEPDGRGFWVLSRHADIVACSRDPQTFSSSALLGGTVQIEDRPANRDEFAAIEEQVMFMMDPPKHTRYRLLVNKAFTPRMIGALEDRVRMRSESIINSVIEQGACDFVVDMAAILPLHLICDLAGVPESDRGDITRWTNEMLPGGDPEFNLSESTAVEALFNLWAVISGLREQRRAQPADDILTGLTQAEIDGERLSDMEVDAFMLLLLSAGNETTRNALAHGIHAFAQNPDEWAKLQAQPELTASAVEEILRWASPVMLFRRNVTRPVSVRGVTFEEGDKVALSYLSGNRDEDVFENPMEFRVDRSPNDHVTFGGGGPHFCLGANLARLEIRVMFEELLRRTPDIVTTGEPVRLRSRELNAVKHLPVAFSPGPLEHRYAAGLVS